MSTRTPFLDAAELPTASRIRRWERRLLGQRPLQTASGFAAQDAPDPRLFTPSEEGSGSFGRWTLDAAGLPAYDYEMDQHADPRAAYRTTEGATRRDHWHQVGNRRVTAFASNNGVLQVYLGDRGGVTLNHFEAAQDAPQPLRSLLFRLLRALILFVTRLLRPAAEKPGIDLFAQSQAAFMPPAANPRGAVPPGALPQTFSAQGADSAQQAAAPPAEDACAGGFSYLWHRGAVWASAYCYRPPGAQTRRRFGIGYFETATEYRGVRVTRRVYAPYGDIPALVADIEIENAADKPLELSHCEYWDVNVHQLRLDWLRSGAFAASGDAARREINQHFVPSVTYDAAAGLLRFSQTLRQPAPPEARPPDDPCDVDWCPADIFLADLSGSPDAVYVNRRAFFGAGGPRQPDAVAQRQPGDALPVSAPDGDPMPYCLALRRDLHLQPGEKRSLRYVYGTARPQQQPAFLDALRQPELFADTLAQWKTALAYFTTGEDPVLQRETAWHTYCLLSAAVYLDYFKAYVVPQGSAYLYLHGADGAPRDQALFALPVVYLDPALARDLLRLIMQVTDARTGQIAYAFAGHGFVSDGMNIHTKPSDLDLFFLLALGEYLAATGDYDFLAVPVPFYPPAESPPGATTLDHVRAALRHLLEENGPGDHGLLKIGSGDWSDSVVLETALRDGPGPFGVTYTNSKEHGESVYNTQMALYVLPLLAALLKERAPDLAEYIHRDDRLERLRAALARQWNPQGWYNRAVLRDALNRPVTLDQLNLEGQVWALVSGAAQADGKADALIEQIDARLDRPSPIGAALLPGGMVWPAVSQLLTWGYARASRDHLAWRSLNRHTFAAHAHAYPDIWLNTWSGPDGINGPASDWPGGTWSSPITPMTDFPVMNANQDGLALLGLLRVCGVEPAADGSGLAIHPHVPRARFALDLPLLRLDVQPGRVALTYRPANAGRRAFTIYHGWGAAQALVSGAAQADVRHEAGCVIVTVEHSSGQTIEIEVVPEAAVSG